MSQNLLIETLNSIKQISIQIVQDQVEQEKQKEACQQIVSQQQIFIEEFKNLQKKLQNEDEQVQTTNEEKSIENNIEFQSFNQTKQYFKSVLKKVDVCQVTHVLQSKVNKQKNEKKIFLDHLLEQSILFSWYNILLQQKKVKEYFQMCIQEKNQQYINEIQEIFQINLIKIVQTNNKNSLADINKKLIEIGKNILLYQNSNTNENMIHFEQICLKIVKNEQIDQLQLNSIPLQYFLRYCMQLIITSFNVFSRLYIIYNDEKGQIKIKNLWINKKQAFVNDFPIFIHIKKTKVFYYLCLTIKLTENELEQKLANLKRNSYKKIKRDKSSSKQNFLESTNVDKNNNIYKDKFFKKKQLKRKSNYQIRFDQSKETKKLHKNKYQNNIYDDLEQIEITKKEQSNQKSKKELQKYKTEDFPTSKLNLLKNSIKKQNEQSEQNTQRSKTVQNKKFNKSIIDFKLTNEDIYKEVKTKNKSKNKIEQNKDKKKNITGIFSYRRTNESFENKNQKQGSSIEKQNQKQDDYTLKPNISKLIRRSKKFQSIRQNDQIKEQIQVQKSGTSLEKKHQNFFQIFESFNQQVDQQLNTFERNDKILSFCVRKQIRQPSIENNNYIKKYNLNQNKVFQHRQKSNNTYTPTNIFYKNKSPILDFRKQNSQNNYISYERIGNLNTSNNQTKIESDL